MFSGARSSYETPDGLMTNRSAPGTRPDTFPPVHTIRPYRTSSAWSAATSARTAAMDASTSAENEGGGVAGSGLVTGSSIGSRVEKSGRASPGTPCYR
jgi:hypothetical protein